jgi:CBS domain-containing protein
MQYAHEIMNRKPFTVTRDTSVSDLARGLLEHRADGAVVVKGREVVGVVTAMDLVFQEKKVHLPTFIAFMDAMLPLGGRRTEAELSKITGATVDEIMSSPPKTVEYDTSLDVVATMMVEDHITVVPVIQDGVLVGVIEKPDVLRAVLASRSQ